MFHSKTHDFLADNRGKTKIYNKHMQKGLVIQDMRYRSLLVLLLVIIIAAGCGNNEDASAPAESSVALTSDTVEQKDETTDEIQETPALNDDVSNTYSTELKDDSSAEDSAFEPNEELNPEKEDTEEAEEAKSSEESTEETSSVAPAEEKKEEPAKEAPAATGAVIDEEEFRRGVMMGPKKGTIVNDDFATGVTNSLISQLNGMGAIQTSDPAPPIFRSKPFRFETTPEDAANAMINDVMPNFGFDMAGKNYFISAVQKFDNGYVVTVGWTRWNQDS